MSLYSRKGKKWGGRSNMTFLALKSLRSNTLCFRAYLQNNTIPSEALSVDGEDWRESQVDLSMIFLMEQRRTRVQ